MMSLRRPSSEVIHRFLLAQSRLGFTYKAVGSTARVSPSVPTGVGIQINTEHTTLWIEGERSSKYAQDHTWIKLGEGEEVFLKAKEALGRWQQFHLGWVELSPPETPIEPGAVVAVLSRRLGIWWLNACRIIYVVDDPGRFGFAYGTLPDHAGMGEERFLVEWDHATEQVWYDILAFSRPRLILTRLGYRYMRRVQKRFGRESAATMLRAVNQVN
jgi:uncharacterized protein (UPF0548 family)